MIFTYWNSLGGVGSGNARLAGTDWRFSGTIHAIGDEPEQPMTAMENASRRL